MTPRQYHNSLLAQKLIGKFSERNIEGYYCATKEDALAKALELIPKTAVISSGGSATIFEIGLEQALRDLGYDYRDPKSGKNAAEMDAIAHEALGADFFLMGANAITADGELVNADGYGNRVAALIFGPKNVLVIAGMNKVTPDIDSAITRVKSYSAELIMLKHSQNYPDYGALCAAAKSACSHLVVTSRSTTKGRIKVILIGEELGY